MDSTIVLLTVYISTIYTVINKKLKNDFFILNNAIALVGLVAPY